MRFSALLLVLMPAATLAAPVPAPDFLGDLGQVIGDIPIVGAIENAIENPDLLVARGQVVAGLSQAEGALKSIINDATGDNTAVGTTATTALDSVHNAHCAAKSIFDALLLSKTPQSADQKTVATNVQIAQTQIGKLTSQVVTTSDQLIHDIGDATRGVTIAVTGTLGVIDILKLSLADVGLTTPLVARDN